MSYWYVVDADFEKSDFFLAKSDIFQTSFTEKSDFRLKSIKSDKGGNTAKVCGRIHAIIILGFKKDKMHTTP